MSTTDYSVSYKSSLPSDKRLVSSYSINVIRLALAQAGMKCAVISSTLRFPEEQASIMYRNARIDLKKQKQLYGKNGDAVLDVYSSNSKKDKHEVIRLMKEKIELLARDGKKVSKHCTTVEDLSIKFEVRHFLQMRMNILRWCSIPKPFAWACI